MHNAKLITVPIDDLVLDFDPRPKPFDDLLNSIIGSGIEVPPLVRRLSNGKYRILDGNRRTRACRQLGYTEIPCWLFEADEKIWRHLLRLAIVQSNMARKDFPLSELALMLADYKREYEWLYPSTAEGAASNEKEARPNDAPSASRVECYAKVAEKIIGMDERSIRRLATIGHEAISKVLRALDEGKITVEDAEEIALLDFDDQFLELDRIDLMHEIKYLRAQQQTAAPAVNKSLEDCFIDVIASVDEFYEAVANAVEEQAAPDLQKRHLYGMVDRILALSHLHCAVHELVCGNLDKARRKVDSIPRELAV